MEAYIINTSMGFVNDNNGDTFIEINDTERNEEINNNYFLFKKIKDIFKIKKSNKIDAEDLV